MRVRLLGPLELDAGGEPAPLRGSRQKAVLAVLAVRANEWVTRDFIIDELWWDDPPRTARNSVQRFVSDLRAALGGDRDRIESGTTGYRLRLDDGELDAHDADGLIAEARRLRNGDRDRAVDAYRRALGLWRGETLADVTDVPVVDATRGRLDELRLAATEEFLELEVELGRHADHLADLSTMVRCHRFRERLWAIYIVALYRAGRQADALAAYEELRAQLVGELGIEPSEPLRDLHLQVLQHAPELSPAVASARVTRDPLARFELGDVIARRQHALVRRATLSTVGRQVAVTVVDAEVANRPDFIRRFEPRLRAIGAVDHPAVLPVLDGWRDATGAYVVTAPYPGGDLTTVTPDLDAADVIRRIGAGLTALHDAGAVHGAVDAAMVWLGDEGSVQLYPATMERPTTDPSADAAGLFELARRLSLVEDPRAATATSIDAVLDAIGGDEIGDRVVVNPYKGLWAFEEADSDDFHGHDELIERLTATVASHRLTTVVGPSGCGKSSVVRAGLLPALRSGALPGSERWFFATVVPGSSPFRQLATALSAIAPDPPSNLVTRLAADDDGIGRVIDMVVPDGDEVLVVVDQFEEIFTVVAARVRKRFLNGLLRAVTQPRSRLRVVATIRADFIDRPLATPGIGQLVEEGAVLVAPLSPQGLQQAIVAPAARVGVSFEDGLPSTIASDVWGQPAALPLLQHALREAFDARTGPVISAADYARIGGVRGALAKRADEVHEGFGTGERAAARQILLRLVTIDGTGEASRDRVERASLLGPELDVDVVDRVLREFGRHRLVTFDRDPISREPTVTVAHEALLTEWGRLRAWIEESSADVTTHRRLGAAVREWIDNDRDASFLASGTQLDQFAGWSETSDLAVSDREAEYIAASLEARRSLEHADRERAERERALERRSVRRLRSLVGVLAVAVLMAAALTAVAVNRSREASEQRTEAELAADTSLRQGLVASARAELGNDPELALLLALEAAKLTEEAGETYDTELVDVLHQGLAEHRLTATIDDATTAQFLPDDRIVVGGADGRIRVVDIDGTPITESRRGHEGLVVDLDVATDGSVAVSVGADATARVWDVRSVLQLLTLPDAVSARMRPDGRAVATASLDGRITLWEVATGRELATRQTGRGGTDDLAYAWTAAGDLLVAAAGGGDLRLLEFDGTTLEPATEPATVLGQFGFFAVPCELAIDPDTSEVVVGRPGLPTAIIDEDGSMRGLGGIAGCALAARENAVAIGGEDSSVALVRPEEGRSLAVLSGHSAAVTTLSFSMDGTRLVSAAADGTARVWDVTQSRPIELASSVIGAIGVEGRVAHMVWSPEGSTVTMSSPGEAVVVEVGDQLVERFRVGDLTLGNVFGIGVFARTAVDPSGTLMAAGTSLSGGVGLFELGTGDVVARLQPAAPGDPVTGVGFDRSGSRVVGVSADGVVSVWDVRDGRLLSTFATADDQTFVEALFAPDDTAVMLISVAGDIEVRDASTGALRRSFRHGGPVIDAVSTPEADILVTAGLDGVIRVWDPTAGEELRSWSTSATLTSLALTEDGLQLFATSTDGVVTQWDTITGSLVATPGRFDGRLAVGVSPDGTRLLVATPGALQLLTTSPDELLDMARERVTRDLRAAECRRFLTLPECPG